MRAWCRLDLGGREFVGMIRAVVDAAAAVAAGVAAVLRALWRQRKGLQEEIAALVDG